MWPILSNAVGPPSIAPIRTSVTSDHIGGDCCAAACVVNSTTMLRHASSRITSPLRFDLRARTNSKHHTARWTRPACRDTKARVDAAAPVGQYDTLAPLWHCHSYTRWVKTAPGRKGDKPRFM